MAIIGRYRSHKRRTRGSVPQSKGDYCEKYRRWTKCEVFSLDQVVECKRSTEAENLDVDVSSGGSVS